MLRNRPEPFRVGVGADCGREMRRRRIAGISRQPLLAVASRKIWPHLLSAPEWIEPLAGLRRPQVPHPIAQRRGSDLALAQTAAPNPAREPKKTRSSLKVCARAKRGARFRATVPHE